jgi:HD-GYP domain-containing protein (c-di-GMP phosphodiesterase class II)
MSSQETIVLCFSKETHLDVYELAFEGIFGGCKTVACRTLTDTAKEMGQLVNASVVVHSAAAGDSLADFIRERDLLAKRTHIFLLGTSPSQLPEGVSRERVDFLPAETSVKEVISKVEAALKIDQKAQQYCKISLKSLLVRKDEIRCDVYMKLSEDKYVKVLNASDRFDGPDFHRFSAKNVEYLYLLRSDFLELMGELAAKLDKIKATGGGDDLGAVISLAGTIYQAVHAALETEGFTPELQKLAASSTGMAVATIQKNPSLKNMLAKLDENRDNYLGWHSIALSYLSCKLATLMGWQSEATFYKLALASFLHDITLPNDELAQLLDLDQINLANLSLADRALVLRHPLTAAQLLGGFGDIPGEVAFIVKQHHERQDGSGFPDGLEAKDMSVVSALFVIAHDIVTAIFHQPPGKFQMEEFLKKRERDQRYTKGPYGQIFRVLIDTQF